MFIGIAEKYNFSRAKSAKERQKISKGLKEWWRQNGGKAIGITVAGGLAGAYGLKKRRDFKLANKDLANLNAIRGLHKNSMSEVTGSVRRAKRHVSTFENQVKDGISVNPVTVNSVLNSIKADYDGAKAAAANYRDLYKGYAKRQRKLRSLNPFVR